MRVALAGKPVREALPPLGLELVEGEWVYEEFVEFGVRALESDAAEAP